MPGFASSPVTHAHHGLGTPIFGTVSSSNTARRVLVTWLQVEIPLGVTTTTDAGSASESASVVVAVPSTDVNGALTENVALKSVSPDANSTTSEDVGLKAVTTDANGGITENVALNFVVADVNAGIAESVAPFVRVTPDANAGIAEDVALKSVSADANGTLTEATLETYQAASSDSDGTFTEANIITVPVAATDANGTLTEAVGLASVFTDVNSGITENVGLASVFTDSGTIVEATADKVVSPDVGTGTEITSAAAKITATDTDGTIVESATIGGRRIRVTWVQVQIPTGIWILTDHSGSIIENATTSVKSTDTNGTITENIVETANLVPVTRTIRKSAAGLIFLYGDKRVTVLSPQLDSGRLSTELAELTNKVSVDTATATENATVVVSGVVSTDNGTALLETVGLKVASTDINNGIVEVSGRNATSVDTNSGITETATFASQFISSDSNTTSGEVTLIVVKSSIADNGTIAETVLTGISTSDIGITSDAIVLVAQINATDLNGTTAEAAGANAFTPISASDSGSTTELIILTAVENTTDASGSTTENGVSAFAQISSDANAGTTEVINTSRAVIDFNNTTIENNLLVATALDTATGIESLGAIGIKSTDTSTGNDSTSNTRISFVSTDHGFAYEFTIIKNPGFPGYLKMRMIPSASIVMKELPSAYLQMRQIMSDVGSVEILQCEFRDRAGNLADPTTIHGWVEEPDETVVELTFVRVSLGIWEATYEITKYIPREDTWWRVQTSGNFQVVGQRKFAKIPEPHAVPA